MTVKRIWIYSEKWNIGRQPQRVNSTAKMASGVVEATRKGILTLNPFGTKLKMPKLNLPSDEFITYESPLRNFLNKLRK